jgi:hypothetical protein
LRRQRPEVDVSRYIVEALISNRYILALTFPHRRLHTRKAKAAIVGEDKDSGFLSGKLLGKGNPSISNENIVLPLR